MQLEVGKKYVLDYGIKRTVVGRCICSDKKGRDGEVTALFLYQWDDGAEHQIATRADGSAFGGVSVVKEYIPPMRVRLVVMRNSVRCVSCSVMEGEEHFSNQRWPFFSDGWTRLSDTIVEVPINGQAGA